MNILIADDESALRDLLIKYMQIEGIEAHGVKNGQEGLDALEANSYDAVLVDLRMPVMDGLEMIKEARRLGFRIPIIMMSAHGETSDAVEALKSGADDYIVKPFSPDELLIRLNQAIEACRSKNIVQAISSPPNNAEDLFIGECNAIKDIKEMVSKMRLASSNVMITGESGTGKEVLARYIHANSPVSSGPFIAINIAGVPENLIESERFGYEKGAFTGANTRKVGLFELAQGGTLFLDEIGDASLSLQVKLLRVIQEKTIMRLGGNTNIPINVRFITATNKNLESMIRDNTFREDLYFRLNVVHFHLPPLHERGNDIVLLSNAMIKKITSKMPSPVTELSKDALKKIISYNFPGNIRELENVLERAIIFSSSDTIEASSVILTNANEHNESDMSSFTMRSAEMNAIKNALAATGGNRTKAADLLGISRRSLISKIEEYGIS